MIKFEAVKKYYGDRLVLDIPELTLQPGKRYALIGPNGSGKSTLLKLISGALNADEGSILIADEHKKRIGYMPQRPYAYSFSVLKNVAIAVRGKNPAAKELAKTALQNVGMSTLLKARGNTLSGGEAQRMAFARMIVEDRPLILLDEPTSSLDIPGTLLVEQAFDAYCKRTGCTVIFATHALSQAERMADEVIFMSHGQVVTCGPVQEVLRAPQDARTASFIRFWQLNDAAKDPVTEENPC